jgi:hypothetical protein
VLVQIENGSGEAIAQAIHERWRVEQRAAGDATPPTWAELDESRRNSCRSQARDIAVKLDRVGCAITPLSDATAAEFSFTDAEVESLGIHEHERWIKERIGSGWTLGPKHVGQKTTPYLVPFADLPPDIAEYDRMFVREIPALLASAGLQVVRVSPKH